MNKRNFSWFLVFLSLDITLIYMMISGYMAYFLHPKMNKFIYFTIFILTDMCLIELFFLVKKKTSLITEHDLWIFLLPVLLLLVFQPKHIDPQTLNNKVSRVDLTTPIKSIENSDSYKETEFSNQPYKFEKPKAPFESLIDEDKQASKAKFSKENSQKRTEDFVKEALDRIKSSAPDPSKNPNHVPTVIEIDRKEIDFARIDGQVFLDLMAKAYKSTNTEDRLKIKGFAFYQDDFEDNQVSISRLLMTCCAADTSIIGMLADTSNIDEKIEQGKWYEFEGSIDHTMAKDPQTKKDTKVPLLKVDKIKAIETPISPYVLSLQ